MSIVSLAEGSLFAGRYRIVRCIAHGGMGAVYEVVHTETQRRRALKVMLPSTLQNQDMRDRFRQEACVTANIESEHIVDVLDAGIDDATQMPFLVMELLRGEELDKRLKRAGRLEPREVVTYLHHVALALDKTHRASIVHRDLKPGNVFLTEREDGSFRAKILDFGVAKLIAEGATSAAATQSLGTPLYMAPEQFNIGQKVSPAADIFALGMMAYTMLVGVPYWQDEIAAGANIFAFAAKAMVGPPEPATARAMRQGASLPPSFDAWFAKATAVAPQNRFPTASAAVAALAEVLGVPFGHERASSVPAAPLITAPTGETRATAPALSPATPGSLSAAAPGAARVVHAGTIPLAQTPVAAALLERTPPPHGPGAPSSPGMEPAPMPAHVTASSMSTTAAVKGPPRAGVAVVLAAVASSLALAVGAGVFLLRGRAEEPPAAQGSDATSTAQPPEPASPLMPPAPSSAGAQPVEPPPQATPSPLAASPEPAPGAPSASSKPPAEGVIAASPSAGPSAPSSARPSVTQGSKAPGSGAPTGPGKKPALTRD